MKVVEHYEICCRRSLNLRRANLYIIKIIIPFLYIYSIMYKLSFQYIIIIIIPFHYIYSIMSKLILEKRVVFFV